MYIAHHRTYDNKIQTVKEHLTETSIICRNLAKKINVPDVGELLGLLHDFGKYSKEFQTYIQSATGILNPDIDNEFVDSELFKGKIDHSTAGAQLVWKKLQQFGNKGRIVGQMLALCLSSHHSGLIDCLSSEGENIFINRMNKDNEKTNLQECEQEADDEILKRINELLTEKLIQTVIPQIKLMFDPEKNQSETISCNTSGLWLRFLFSCLIDADRINSIDFENPNNKKLRQENKTDWEIPINRMENKLDKLPIKNEIDLIRRSVSNQCKNRALDKQGVYRLTVPTGGGKTFASMRYALHHAHKHKLDRIIYIIPYTSIIEQNAQAIREMLETTNDKFPWVLEHHSNLEPERQTWYTKLTTENWDSPIVFTTMVQFLNTLFGGGTRGPRRMHQLANSVLIFDEIQTLPIKCVHLFCNAINFLNSYTNTTALLCTATQSSLHELKNPEKGQLKMSENSELIAGTHELFDSLKRVTISDKRRKNGWNAEALTGLAIKEFKQKNSCLVITNTKKWAKEVYESCENKTNKKNIFYLSTNLCSAHRKKILSEIKQRLNDKLPVLCVSTQLIEAGIDIDFASVIRFVAGLDSISQAAGRCNRNGLLPQATVHLVNPDQEYLNKLQDIKKGSNETSRILTEINNSDLLDPDTIALYFKYYFHSQSDKMDYPLTKDQIGRHDSLLNILSNNTLNIGIAKNILFKQSFKKAGQLFKTIEAPTETVIVPYGDGKKIITELCTTPEPAKAYTLLKHAQKFSVNVFPNVWKKLIENQAITPIQDNEEIYYLDEQYYSDKFGLSEKKINKFDLLII